MFLSCTPVPADWGAVFDLENSSWLILDGKLCVILFSVGDSVCLSLRCETVAGFLVIVLVRKPLKAKGSRDIISFELKFLEKKLSNFFCIFDKVPTFSVCPCFRLSLFSADINNFSKGTKWLFNER